MKIICYLSYGFPTIDESLKIAECYIESGCDMIECCLPTDDAYLDPEFLSDKMKQSLSVCSDYEVYLKKLSEFTKKHPDTRLILVIYESLIAEIGVDRLIAFMKDNGIKDLIYAGDVRRPEIRQRLIDGGIRLSSPVSHLMTEEELDGAVNSNGFVYMEGKPARGVRPGFETLERCIAELRRLGIDRPIYCGVGIHTPDDVRLVKRAKGDGVFIGSALVRQYDDKAGIARTIGEFKAAAEERV